MGDHGRREQPAALPEPGDDVVVHFQHAATHERLGAGRESARGIDRTHDREPGALTDLEVLLAVPGCRVNEAGAILHAHERRAVDDARVAAPGALEHRVHEVCSQQALDHRGLRPAGGIPNRRESRLGQQEVGTTVAHDDVTGGGIHHQPEVRGQCPGGRGPGHGRERRVPLEPASRVAPEREQHVDRRGEVVLVFDLGLGQRRSVGGTPVDRALPTLDELLGRQPGERLEDRGLELGVHRQVGAAPVAPASETLELVALDRDPLRRVLAARPAQRQSVHAGIARPQLLSDLHLDRHAVVVPAGHERRVVAQEVRLPHRSVLPDLVGRGPHVQVAVGIGGSVVEQPHRTAPPRLTQPGVEVALLPPRDPLRLAAREIGLHRELGLRKVQRVAIASHGYLRARDVANAGENEKRPTVPAPLGRTRSRYHPTSLRPRGAEPREPIVSARARSRWATRPILLGRLG